MNIVNMSPHRTSVHYRASAATSVPGSLDPRMISASWSQGEIVPRYFLLKMNFFSHFSLNISPCLATPPPQRAEHWDQEDQGAQPDQARDTGAPGQHTSGLEPWQTRQILVVLFFYYFIESF